MKGAWTKLQLDHTQRWRSKSSRPEYSFILSFIPVSFPQLYVTEWRRLYVDPQVFLTPLCCSSCYVPQDTFSLSRFGFSFFSFGFCGWRQRKGFQLNSLVSSKLMVWVQLNSTTFFLFLPHKIYFNDLSSLSISGGNELLNFYLCVLISQQRSHTYPLVSVQPHRNVT